MAAAPVRPPLSRHGARHIASRRLTTSTLPESLGIYRFVFTRARNPVRAFAVQLAEIRLYTADGALLSVLSATNPSRYNPDPQVNVLAVVVLAGPLVWPAYATQGLCTPIPDGSKTMLVPSAHHLTAHVRRACGCCLTAGGQCPLTGAVPDG